MASKRGDGPSATRAPASGINVRVDKEVYDAILSRAHELEKEHGRRVSMNDALRAVILGEEV